MIVVSEMGEQWSPQTAPAMHADTQMIARGLPLSRGNALSVIGINMPNVPHDVPVAKDRPHAIRNMIAGRMLRKLPLLWSTMFATYSAAPRESVMALRDHARVRIVMGATIALKPSSMHFMHSLNLSTRRVR